MKRNNLLTLRGLLAAILGGIVLLSSCSQDETASDFSDPSREVTFTAYAKKGSRTRVAETTSETIMDFTVYAINSEYGALANLTNKTVSRANENSPWTYSPKQVWPSVGTINFYAYSPASPTGNSLSYDDKIITYTVPAPTSDFETSTQQDLLVAVEPNVNSTNRVPVNLNFQHALSRIQIKARSVTAGTSYKIYSVEFLNLKTSGTLNLDGDEIEIPHSESENSSFDYGDNSAPNRTPLVLWESPENATTENYVFDFVGAPTTIVGDQENYASIISEENAFLLLPQTTELGTPQTANHLFGSNEELESFESLDVLDQIEDPKDGKFYIKIVFAPTSGAGNAVQARYFAVKQPGTEDALTFEIGRSYTFVVDLSTSDFIEFGDVLVQSSDKFFSSDENPVKHTPPPAPADPNPVENEAYEPRPHQGFAGSNIYWDGEKLTFDGVGVTEHEQYQGLFFKWGSLVGISPKGTDQAPYTNSTVIYTPTGTNGAYAANSNGNGIWTNIAISDRDFSSGIGEIEDLRTSGFVTYLNTVDDNLNAYQGDICAYLSGREGIPAGHWRLPTSAEFEPGYNPDVLFESPGQYTRIVAGEENELSNFGLIMESTKDDGTFKINNGYRLTYAPDKTTFFPASGYRDHDNNAALRNVGVAGVAWSSSPEANAAKSHYMYFTDTEVFPVHTNYRSYALPVRCVKK